MNQETKSFIANLNVGVLAIDRLEGGSHAAALHFAPSEDFSSFIFMTSPKSRKCEAFKQKDGARASLVIGMNEGDMRTFQAEGTVSITADQSAKDAYFAKFPGRKEAYESGGPVLLIFKAGWWRYSDLTQTDGRKIWGSESAS